MSDREIIETIKKIKKHCAFEGCYNCIFSLKNQRCQIMWLTGLLANMPYRWDIKKIEDIICK